MTAQLNQFPGSAFTSATDVVIVNDIGVALGSYIAAESGLSTGASDNSTALNLLIARIRTLGVPAEIVFEGGTYDFQAGLTDSTDGCLVVLRGVGMRGTYFRATGTLVTTGDFVTLNKSKNFHVRGITFTASSVRSAGTRCIVVKGASIITSTPSTADQNIRFDGCGMENMYDGVQLDDSSGPLGVIGFWWVGPSMLRNFAAGGRCFILNSPNGAVNYFLYTTHAETAGVAAGSRPNSTMLINSAWDMRAVFIESVYARNGLLIQPGAGITANACWFDSCIWGSVTDTCVGITPNAAGAVGFGKFNNNWCDSGTGMVLTGAVITEFICDGLTVLGCTDAVKLDGVTDSTKIDVSARGCGRGFYATGSSKNFDAIVRISTSATTGAQIDVGCANFSLRLVGAIVNATTALTDNSGGVTKNVINV